MRCGAASSQRRRGQDRGGSGDRAPSPCAPGRPRDARGVVGRYHPSIPPSNARQRGGQGPSEGGGRVRRAAPGARAPPRPGAWRPDGDGGGGAAQPRGAPPTDHGSGTRERRGRPLDPGLAASARDRRTGTAGQDRPPGFLPSRFAPADSGPRSTDPRLTPHANRPPLSLLPALKHESPVSGD